MKAHDRELHIRYNKIIHWEIKLPRFQRYEAWDRKRITSLLNVIINDLPLWVTLLLQVWDKEKFDSRYIETAIPETPLKVTEHLLDWQQRLTALRRALNNNYEKEKFFIYIPEFDKCNKTLRFEEVNIFYQSRYDKKWKKFPLRADSPEEMFLRWCIPFELLRPIDVADEIDKRIKEACKWLNPDKKDVDYSTKIVNYFETIDKIKSKISDLRETVKHFNLPYLELTSETQKDIALEVFINMNTNSKPLSMYDIIVAEIEMQKWESLHDLQDGLDKNYPEVKDYFELNQLILYTSALLQDKLPNQKWLIDMDKKSLVDNWDKMSIWLHKMSQFLRAENIFDRERLPTNAVLAVIAALYSYIPEHWDKRWLDELLLKKYLWSSFFTDRYENSAAAAAYSDYIALKNLITGNKKKDWTDYTEDDVLVLNRKEYPISIVDELVSVWWPKRENIRARWILAITIKLWAIDFADWQHITKENILKRDYHHIFPRALLEEANIDGDLALNCTLLTAHTNRNIGRKAPLDYMKDRYDRSDESTINERLNSHLIPVNELSTGWYDDLNEEERKEKIKSDFDKFITKRADLINKAVKLLTQWKTITTNMVFLEERIEEEAESEEILIQPENPFSNRLNYIEMINWCEEYIYWMDKYFTTKWLEFLSRWINYGKIKEVRILSSIKSVDEELRKDFKYFKEELSNKWINVEMRILINKNTLQELHDRYLLSKNKSFIIPSPDVVSRNQLSSIKETNSNIPFEEYRNEWIDLISDWNKIKEKLS